MSALEILPPAEIIPPINDVAEALTVVEAKPAAALFAGAIDPIVTKIKEHARSEAAKLDVSREKDRKAIASLAYKVARAKGMIEDKRKELVADEKKRLAKIDAEGKRVREELDALKDEVRKPLDEFEDAEAQRVQRLEQGIAELEADASFDHPPTTAELEERIAYVEGYAIDNFQEFSQRAALAKSTTLAALTKQLEASHKADAERAELERLRKEAAAREQKEREERIAREAKEKAEREAKEREERMAQEAREREERAIREKREAEERVAKAEQERKAAEERAQREKEESELRAKDAAEAAAKAEREKIAHEQREAEEAERKREADKRHCVQINREALSALVAAGIDENTGKLVIALIVKGQVPHISIQY